MAPPSQTTDLYNAINGGAAPPPILAAPAAPAAQLALVGRATSSRSCSTPTLAPASAGPSHHRGRIGRRQDWLAQEGLAVIAARGGRVLTARPHPGEQGLADGVIAALRREAIGAEATIADEHLRSDAARLLPELGTPPPNSLDDPGARLRFPESIAGRCSQPSSGARASCGSTICSGATQPRWTRSRTLHGASPASRCCCSGRGAPTSPTPSASMPASRSSASAWRSAV